MKESKDNILSGKDNKALNKVHSTNNEGTAAWSNAEKILDPSHVSIPSEYNVEKAKNWVDNGSQL